MNPASLENARNIVWIATMVITTIAVVVIVVDQVQRNRKADKFIEGIR